MAWPWAPGGRRVAAFVMIASGLLTAPGASAPTVTPRLGGMTAGTAIRDAVDTVRGWLMGVRTDRRVVITTSDGTRLATTVMRPMFPRGPLPTVLLRTPYGRASMGRGWARQGFVAVTQDLRGRGESTGVFLPYAHEAADTARTLDWIAAQPWSNGRVGTLGCSALGEVQLIAARARHPAHRALVAEGAGGAVGSVDGHHTPFAAYEGGIFQLASALGWFARQGDRGRADGQPAASAESIAAALRTLPVLGMDRRAGALDTGFDHLRRLALGDGAWQQLGYLADSDRFATAGLHVNGWYDQGVSETLAAAALMRRHADDPATSPQHVVIGPGLHCDDPGPARGRVGDLDHAGGHQPFEGLYQRWLSAWLTLDPEEAARSLADLPAYQVFVLRENRWIEAQRWPPEDSTRERWYLTSQGRANSREGDGRLLPTPAGGPTQTDRFLADPEHPVPTRGGAFCCTGDPAARQGPVDQADVEIRRDVLVYTSAPLDRPLRIVGPISLEVEVSTTGHDGDLVAKLVDVAPDGRALAIQSGALRLRFREGVQHATSVTPGQRMRVRVPMRDIAWRVEARHRLRLQIAGSDFPRLERNLHTGGNNFDETAGRIAEHRIHHGGAALGFVEFHTVPDLP
jgi:uncharacterized protein